jgi:AcrR family transcriptional regulator
MSRPRFEKLDPQRQERLFASAAEEFGEKGYDAASLNRILERSGMSKSSLYYYFDDKADLFTTMLERALAFLIKEIGGFDVETLTAETFWSEFVTLYRRSIVLVNRNTWYLKLGRMFYRLHDTSKQGAPTGHIFDAARHWIGKIISRGQALGVVRTDLPTPLLIGCAMGIGEALDRWAIVYWDQYDEDELMQMAEEHIDLFRRLLAPPEVR